MNIKIKNITIETLKGDICNQPDIDVIVNAANAELKTGGGVAGAIHRAAGPGLEAECRPYAPIHTGETVITSAFNLPNKYIIHCLGPVYGKDHPENELLKDCYKNTLRLADKYNVHSIAFPAISTGAFGFPLRDAATISINTIKAMIPELKNIKHIRFILFSNNDLEIFNSILNS